MRKLSVCFLVLLFQPAMLCATPILDFTNNTVTPFGNGNQTLGWAFDVTSPITVDGLGTFDYNPVGLDESHEVGLWNEDGSVLLATTTITNASTPVASTSSNGRWLFNDITPLELPVGRYLLGTLHVGQTDLLAAEATFVTIPEIAYVERRVSSPGNPLSPPVLVPVVDINGQWGPNLRVQVVPEPSAILSLMAGAAVMLARRSRRRG